jgi:hypothetical protein
MSEPTIQHVSDTALWAAAFRARETERKDGLFRDPFARRLAGARGEKIAKATPFHEKNSWSWVTRTYLFDRIILEQIGQGADTVEAGSALDVADRCGIEANALPAQSVRTSAGQRHVCRTKRRAGRSGPGRGFVCSGPSEVGQDDSRRG